MTDLEGAILAGGRSRRMGRDKAALRIGGIPMLVRVANTLSSVVEQIRVVGNDVTETGGFPNQPDLRPGLGPLSGIHAALATTHASAVLVVACDLPFVTPALLRRLVEELTPAMEAALPRIAGRAVPVCAVYRATCLDALEACLDRGELQAQEFVAELNARFITDDELARIDPERLALKNINTPADLGQAEAIVQRKHR